MTGVLDLFLDTPEPEVRLIDAGELLGSLPDSSVQLVITDPPYGISYQSNHRKDGKTAPIHNDWNFQIGPFLQEVQRVLRDGGVCYLFSRWDIYPLWAQCCPPGLKLKNVIAWVKDNHSAGDLEGNFGFKYESVLFLTKGRHKLRGKRWTNVWEFPRVPFGRSLHPAEKPVALLIRAIESSSDPGDLVVDPFCGSGSTGEAARLIGRRCLLGDSDPKYVRVAKERLGLSTDGLPAAPVVRSKLQEQNFSPCFDALDGIHPEDVAAMLEDWQKSRKLN